MKAVALLGAYAVMAGAWVLRLEVASAVAAAPLPREGTWRVSGTGHDGSKWAGILNLRRTADGAYTGVLRWAEPARAGVERLSGSLDVSAGQIKLSEHNPPGTAGTIWYQIRPSANGSAMSLVRWTKTRTWTRLGPGSTETHLLDLPTVTTIATAKLVARRIGP